MAAVKPSTRMIRIDRAFTTLTRRSLALQTIFHVELRSRFRQSWVLQLWGGLIS